MVKMIKQRTKMGSSEKNINVFVHMFIYIYACDNNYKRKTGYQLQGGTWKLWLEGSCRKLKGGKGGGSEGILFN